MNRQVRISTINIVCTEKCNLECIYCYRKVRRKLEMCVDNENVLKELERIKNAEITEVVLTGGEPMLFTNINKLIRMFAQKRKTILTNGIIPIKELDEVDEIVISVDGKEDAMYLNRGVSHEQYNIIRKNIDYYLKNKKQVTIHCVVTRYNINNLLGWIKDEPFIGQMRFRIVPVSNIYNKSEIGLSQSHYGLLIETLKRILQEYNFHLDISTNAVSKRKFMDMVSIENPFMIAPDFNLSTGRYELFDEEYGSYDMMLDNYYLKMKNVTQEILDFLEKQGEQYLFDPYSLAEKLLKEGGN